MKKQYCNCRNSSRVGVLKLMLPCRYHSIIYIQQKFLLSTIISRCNYLNFSPLDFYQTLQQYPNYYF